MKQKKLWLCFCIALAFLTGSVYVQAQSLSIGDGSTNSPVIPITMSTPDAVEGFVLSISFDETNAAASDILAAGATLENGAELVVPKILPGEGVTLGVVMDFNAPYDGQVIPAGNDILIAELVMSATTVLQCGDSLTVDIEFTDGLGQPALNNIIVSGGMSNSAAETLALNNGAFEILGTCSPMRVVTTQGAPGATSVDVAIEVDNSDPVEGYVISLAHQSGMILERITSAGTDAAAVPGGVEFEVAKRYPQTGDVGAEGGTLGVVLDFDPPYDGQVLEPGVNQSIAICTYSNAPFECTDDPEANAQTYAIAFADNAFGAPALSNILVSAGMSVVPTLENGTVTFNCTPPAGIDFYVGADTGGEAPEIIPAVGTIGAESKVSLYYTSDYQPIQGLSMALNFPTALQIADLDATGQGMVSDKHLEGTVTEGINAEFVSFNAAEGELIVGILVDSTPPIPLEHMYPPTRTLAKVMNVYFAIPEGATCDTVYDLTFEDGLTGAGVVPINNRAAVLNESLPARLHAGSLTVGGRATFIRGDCNTDQEVDIADPAATMSYLFLKVYDPSCMDACDSNDDGVVDLADVVSTLRFLFQQGDELPAPGPYVPGEDPTPDIYGLDLGCKAGDPCEEG